LAKSAKPQARFDWANWRLSCMDCNNQKGTQRVVDPVRKDPRSYIVFNLATGRPEVIAVKRAKPIAETTRDMLNNQTLNEARRTARVRMVEILTRVAQGDLAAQKELDGVLDRPRDAAPRDAPRARPRDGWHAESVPEDRGRRHRSRPAAPGMGDRSPLSCYQSEAGAHGAPGAPLVSIVSGSTI
jgi:hypothetical protein